MKQRSSLFRREAVEAQNVMNGRTRISPPPSWLATNMLLGALVGGGILFASLASYARTVDAPGIVDTTQGTPIIEAEQRGVLEIKAGLGEKVEAGDVVAITRNISQSEQGNLGSMRRAASMEEAERAQFRATAVQDAGRAQAAAKQAQADAAGLRINSLQEQLKQAREQTARAERDLARASQIAERGFLSRRDLDARESAVAEKRQAEAALVGQIAAARGERDVALAEAGHALDEARADASAASGDASRARRSALSQDAVGSIVHVASASGQIASLPLRDGSIVNSGEVIAVIVPEESERVARINVPARLMTDLKAGEQVRIAVDAYPYQTFGMIKSRIRSVSRAPVQTEDGPVFIVEAVLPSALAYYGRPVDLLPGMTLRVRIRTKERTMLQWLLDPLYAVARR